MFDIAKGTGARIVHASGYECVPSDLLALLAAQTMRERHGCACKSLKFFLDGSFGGFSGGSLATQRYYWKRGGMEGEEWDPPYALDPPTGTGGPDPASGDSPDVAYDEFAQTWHAPFVLAKYNGKVIRRSNALLNYKYGRNCSYTEVTACSSFPAALAMKAIMGSVDYLLSGPPSTTFAGLLPQPGEGPSKWVRETGYFKGFTVAVGETAAQPVVIARIDSGTTGDPGYKSTAQMCVESALGLALDTQQLPDVGGGVLTPAVALGNVLIDRLAASGMKFSVDP